MVMQVNQELCAGCGVCMEACPAGAIRLVDYRAVIDDELCILCKACMDACPNEAITALAIPTRSTSSITLPEPKSRIISVPTQTKLLEIGAPGRGLAPLARVTLAYLGREITPRLVDVLVTALKRRLERPAAEDMPLLSTTSRSLTRIRGIRRQTRYRGRRSFIGNYRERR
jgi:NAD-dependent dihydropyrimidine dehydrogenase PreA subunit